MARHINSLKIVTTSICKIPPDLPLPKGGITPLWQRGGGEIFQCLCQFNYEFVNKSIILILVTVLASIIPLMKGEVHAQLKKKPTLHQEARKDPFSLPSGVRLLSQEVPVVQADKKMASIPETKPAEIKPVEVPLKLKAILITDHVRLASIDRHIVTLGDSINGEKVIEIRSDRVVLEKEGKKKTLLLDQSPVKITVEGR